MTDFLSNPHTLILHKHPYQQCATCVMDTSDPEITFDASGRCSYCLRHELYLRTLGSAEDRAEVLSRIVTRIASDGRGREYDCIIGLSGGTDSSYLAYYTVKVMRLRPLMVHVDAGWNSELAVSNIEGVCKTLGVDLHTLVVDWPEMRDLQRAYFLSGVANIDVPQDHAFEAAMIREARRYGIRHVLNGGNMQTESILPEAWGYDASDAVSLRAIHDRFGRVPLRTFPIHSNVAQFLVDPYFHRMQVHRPLEYVDYNKTAAKALIAEAFGWRDYGGKHYESRFTRFFQSHYLPTRFGFDKRKAHLASLVVSGQLSRDEALREIEQPLYSPTELESDIAFFCKKLDLTRTEYESVMRSPPRFYYEFRNRRIVLDRLRRIKHRLLGQPGQSRSR